MADSVTPAKVYTLPAQQGEGAAMIIVSTKGEQSNATDQQRRQHDR